MTLHITDSWKSNSAMKKQWGCWFKICFNEGSREAWHAAVHGVANSRTRLSNWTAEALLLLSRFSRVRLCGTPETAAHQAPPSLGFSRQEHWSGLPFPSPAKALVEMKSSTALERKKKKKSWGLRIEQRTTEPVEQRRWLFSATGQHLRPNFILQAL